jgi:hypothetical protein
MDDDRSADLDLIVEGGRDAGDDEPTLQSASPSALRRPRMVSDRQGRRADRALRRAECRATGVAAVPSTYAAELRNRGQATRRPTQTVVT